MSTKPKYTYQPDYLIAPGETIAETIASLNMTQKEFATRLDITEQSLIRIIKADQPITYETAAKLEMVTGTPASFWNSLESKYREALVHQQELDSFESEIAWLKTIPFKTLVERGYVAASPDKALQVRESLAFYGVSNVDAWNGIWESPKAAARRSTCFKTNPGAASAWLRMAEMEAQKIECVTYNESVFRCALTEIRNLTNLRPEIFSQKMVQLCAQAGVALVFIPEMKGVPWNGATRWLNNQNAIILLSLRGKSEDKFWFSFFHEASHVLHDDRKGLYIADNSKDETEVKADRFAAEMLIPARYNDEIQKAVSAAQIKRLARNIGVSEGIVAGRWQYLHKTFSRFNDLKRKLVWAEK